ncbi:MAG: hypothetical protein Q3971_06695 [Moraxella sp.]|nr:hypothetical protein [Moraxella sp.]
MIYVISALVYVIVLLSGLYVAKTRPVKCERVIVKLCFVGFVLQLMVNYLFWGSGASNFNPLAMIVGAERSAINLMFLALVSIFCYASLLTILFKAKDFYEE